MATCYLITNLRNGKMYVGFTKRSLRTRWAEHCSTGKLGKNLALANALAKYGSDSFKIHALGRGTIPDMLSLERTKIAELGTLAPAGYNLTEGGEFAPYGDASRAKMSASAKRRAATEDRTAQLTDASRARWERPGARKRASETRRKYRKPGIAERNDAIRRRYAEGGISQAALANEFSISQPLVSLVIRRKR